MSIDKLAQKVIDAYAHDPEGLTVVECLQLGLDIEKSKALREVLGKGAEGAVTAEERELLDAKGFSEKFISTIAGSDGKRTLSERIKWLGDNAVEKWYRKDYSVELRTKFVEELGEMGPETIPALLEAKGDDDLYIRALAFMEIENFGSEAIPMFEEELKSISKYDRTIAVEMLGKIGPQAVPVIIDALKDRNWLVRLTAARELGQIGPGAREAKPALESMSKSDSDSGVRDMAAEAVQKIQH